MKSKHPLRFLAVFSIVLALFSLAGGHWALLQSVAWANMIHDYSAQGSLQTALAKTFSGKYPCSLCKKITEEKQKESKSDAIVNDFQKIKTSCWSNSIDILTPSFKDGNYPEIVSFCYSDFIEEPPVPFPKLG